MKIHSDMNLDELVPLMGERHGIGRPAEARVASVDEAIAMRELLVRDFCGKDTDEIDGGLWQSYCCAVDSHEQI
ncbi:hypothetical protein GO290_02725 [Ralstonia solanacearum]|nr:hypothetical protein [Ralstonia solanacearum]BCN13335.1 hypothetical protein RPSD_52200 [Ralstonia solanacearum]